MGYTRASFNLAILIRNERVREEEKKIFNRTHVELGEIERLFDVGGQTRSSIRFADHMDCVSCERWLEFFRWLEKRIGTKF